MDSSTNAFDNDKKFDWIIIKHVSVLKFLTNTYKSKRLPIS